MSTRSNLRFVVPLALCFLLVVTSAFSEIGILNSSTSTSNAFTFSAASGKNRAVVVAVGAELSGANEISDISYGGFSMTKIEDVIVQSGAREYSALFYLLESDIAGRANDNVSVTWSNGTGNVNSESYVILTIDNVLQSNPVESTDENSSTSATVITSSAAVSGDGHDFLITTADKGLSSATWTPGGSLTELVDFGSTSQQTTVAYYSFPSTSSISPSLTSTGSASRISMVTAVFNFICAPGGVSDNLVAWYKADGDINTGGTTVTSWENEISSRPDLTTIDSDPDLTDNSVNYHPAVVFDGNDRVYESGILGTNYMSASDNSMYVVCNLRSGVVFAKWQEAGNLNRIAMEGSGSFNRFDFPTENAANRATGTTNIIDQWMVHEGVTSSTTDTLFVNGIQDATATGGTATTHTSTGEYSLGSDGFFPATVDISEVIHYDEHLGGNQRTQVQTYLAVKYGITLGSTANTISYLNSNEATVWTGSGTYQNDIAGIGRDDASCLDQRQGTSVNSDAVIAMGLGTIAASNSANINSFSADQSYMLWGNDNDDDGTIEAVNTELPNGILERLDREWIIEETGTVGNVEVNMDLNGISNAGSTLYDYFMLIDTDGDGDFTTGSITKIRADDVTSNVITFNAVDFTDGWVFTLGTQICAPAGVSTGLHMWLKADEDVTGAADVTAWADQGPKGFDATATDGPTLLSTGINYNPTMDFNGSSEELIVSGGIFEGITKENIFTYLVNKTNTVVNSAVLQERFSATNIRYSIHLPWGDGVTYYDLGGCCTSSRVSGAWGTEVGKYHVWTFGTSTGTSTPSGSRKEIMRDRVTVATNNNNDSGTGVGNDLNIGGGVTGLYHDGEVPEIIVLDDVPSSAEQERIQSYLAVKYGITLGTTSSTFDYSNSAGSTIWTGDGTYQNGIAGIGRDDDGCLNQKQSHFGR